MKPGQLSGIDPFVRRRASVVIIAGVLFGGPAAAAAGALQGSWPALGMAVSFAGSCRASLRARR